ncbi:endonuclease/exonuclease/phosphatase family protein [Arenibacter certesii]|uniref:Endonuclease n=1 Tax=Arenibacter certesii TaxID=228955 RepID=A0A918IY15_9FLAO|nr:endonuclease/exonuclease/phosphatase family protein [Arenibacter certesii]GGW38213.1 endonuclease [Arenibacter certesii]
MDFSIFNRKSVQNVYTIAFYNLENLFDTTVDQNTLDLDFTPNGSRKWTTRRYNRKLEKLAATIPKIGFDATGKPPVLVGVAEIEKGSVIQALLETEPLKEHHYDYVHYKSPDDRGMDTALIYHRDHFKVIQSAPIPLIIPAKGDKEATRDILYIHGILNGEMVHVFVNHWPSRRTGNHETDYKRIAAAKTIISYMEFIEEEFKDPNYIVMGDFNDGPGSDSIQTLVNIGKLYNPMESLRSPSRGSVSYRRSWNLFDQILISHNFFNYKEGTHSFSSADIFDKSFLMESKGRYKGKPFRTYVGEKYNGGYSDHFPVYVQLELN